MTVYNPGLSKGRIYQAMCLLLSDRYSQVAWEQFAPEEWIEFAKLAHEEGVAPLLFQKLAGTRSGNNFPETVRREHAEFYNHLADDYYRSSAQNQLLFSELGKITDALEMAEIPNLILKGAALATDLYPDIALRPMNDIDLLVDRRDVEAAVGAILPLGYQVVLPEHLGMAGWVDAAINHHIHMSGGSTHNLAVELHWNLVAGEADWRSPRLDWFWREAVPGNLPGAAGRDVVGSQHHHQPVGGRALSPTATLLYQAAHLVLQHGEYRSILLWYYDLHLLLEKRYADIRWGEIAEIAQELHWADALRTALMAIRGLFNSPVPQAVLDKLEGYSEPRARRIIALNARAPEQRTLDTWQGLQVYDLPTRLRLIVALAFPRPAYLRWRYHPSPEWLWPVYYPYRWLDLSTDHVAAILRKRSGHPN